MRFLFVFSVVFYITAAVCPTGYSQGPDGSTCYKVYPALKTRNDAVRACQQDGSFLASIPNSFTNLFIDSNARDVGATTVWTGLTCTGNTYNSCEYDDGFTFLNAQSYTNFYPGNPNSDTGNCILMAVNGQGIAGTWFSADCLKMNASYACVYNGNPAENSCSADYTLFNNNCYKVVSANDELTAEAVCEADCGYITSILNQNENAFVLGLAANYSNTNIYARIGLKLAANPTAGYSWEDGTPLTGFTNWGYMNSNLGNCVGMALTNDLIPQGQWVNTKCETNITSVCKKDVGSICHPVSSGPTLTPVQCQTVHPYVFNNNGTIYSPGYPQKAQPNVCEYLMISPVNEIARIRFSQMQLDHDSYIELYDDITSTIPHYVIKNTANPNNYYYSTENEMKMIYYSYTSFGDLWVGNYDSVLGTATTSSPLSLSGCNQGLLMAPGTITSPNYPKNYPNNANCQYLLGVTGSNHVKLHFNEIKTEQNIDLIIVYDGINNKTPVLARLSGTNPPTHDYISTGNRMFVTFASDSIDNDTGFSALFTSA